MYICRTIIIFRFAHKSYRDIGGISTNTFTTTTTTKDSTTGHEMNIDLMIDHVRWKRIVQSAKTPEGLYSYGVSRKEND